MRIHSDLHTDTKICVPLTSRIFQAHIDDLEEWINKAQDEDTKRDYQRRKARMTGLFNRVQIEDPTTSTK